MRHMIVNRGIWIRPEPELWDRLESLKLKYPLLSKTRLTLAAVRLGVAQIEASCPSGAPVGIAPSF